MSKWLNKLIVGFVVIVALVAAVATLREQILQDDTTNKAFVALLSSFPFAQFTTQIVCNVLHYPLPLFGLQPSNFLDDLILLFAMTMVCPLVIGTASAIFLRIPKEWGIDEREDYMSSFGYRIKEVLLSVILSPLCVFATARLVSMLMGFVQAHVPVFAAYLIRVCVLVLVLLLSCIFASIRSRFGFQFVLRFRVLNDLLGEILKVLVMNTLCIAASLALINGHLSAALYSMVLLVILLAGIELMTGWLFRKAF